jgi:hypothetical protein
MIVRDEQLQGLGLEDAVSRWYRSSILVVKRLWPGTVIAADTGGQSLLYRLPGASRGPGKRDVRLAASIISVA